MAGVDSVQEVVAQRLDGLQAQIDRRIQTEQRELRAEITHIRDYVDTRFTALQLAVDKAEDGINRRLDLLNEFRAQSADEAKKFSLREVVEQQIESMVNRISALEGDRRERGGKEDILTKADARAIQNKAWATAAAGILVAAVGIAVGAFT